MDGEPGHQLDALAPGDGPSSHGRRPPSLNFVTFGSFDQLHRFPISQLAWRERFTAEGKDAPIVPRSLPPNREIVLPTFGPSGELMLFSTQTLFNPLSKRPFSGMETSRQE